MQESTESPGRGAGAADGEAVSPIALTIFLSAFLLFQVQLVIAKRILPWFGSTPGVWTTCMLFFQVLLLAGYAYSHLLVSRLRVRWQAIVHLALLALAVSTLPITPSEGLEPETADAPIRDILFVLAISVGVPYFSLATTGPLLQAWWARLRPGSSPYRLYALSNVGSLLALLSYPLAFERILALQQQTALWSVAYGAFALLCGLCAYRLMAASPPPLSMPEGTSRPGAILAARPRAPSVVMWLLLSATGSTLLLATTNQMCLDVAVVPFLWVVPLSIYLLSFVICFESDRWYSRRLFFGLLHIALIEAVRLLDGGVHVSLAEQVGGYSAILFISCTCCHGELARLRPAPRHLTLFFLVVSSGGALGGVFVAVLAPALFSGFHEYPLGLVVAYSLIGGVVLKHLVSSGEGARSSRASRVLTTVSWLLVLTAAAFAGVRYFDRRTWIGDDAGGSLVSLWNSWRGGSSAVALWAALAVLLGWEALRRSRQEGVRAWWGCPRRLAQLVAVASIAAAALLLTGSLGWIQRDSERRRIARDRNFYHRADHPGVQRRWQQPSMDAEPRPDQARLPVQEAAGMADLLLRNPERRRPGDRAPSRPPPAGLPLPRRLRRPRGRDPRRAPARPDRCLALGSRLHRSRPS